MKMALGGAGEDHDDDLEDVKVRLGALEEAVSKLTDPAGGGGNSSSGIVADNAHAQQPSSTLLPAEQPAGFAAEILRAKLELTNEIHSLGKETNDKLAIVTGEIAGLTLELRGHRGEINTHVAVFRGEMKLATTGISGLKSDMTDVKEDIEGIKLGVQGAQGGIASLQSDVTDVKEDVEGIQEDIESLKLGVAGLKSDIAGLKSDTTDGKEDNKVIRKDIESLKLGVAGLKSDIAGLKSDTKDISSFKADATNQFYTLAVVLAFLAAAIGKLSLGDVTSLIGK